jgi:hypothetical protein
MSGGSQLRKEREARVKNALAERGFRRQRDKERYRRREGMEAPLQAQLLVLGEHRPLRAGAHRGSGRGGLRRLDDAYDSAPEEALSEGQQIYRDRRMHPLASVNFKRLAPDAPHNVPFEWTASTAEGGVEAVDAFFAFVDGPVEAWLDGRSTVAGLRTAADHDDHRGLLPEIVRNMAVHDALSGDAAAAHERVQRYAQAPDDRSDSPEQAEAFRRWLDTVAPLPHS